MGWRVLPVHNVRQTNGESICSCDSDCDPKNHGKHPRIKGWQKKATVASERICNWWSRWPDANIAVATGPESGVVVIDDDLYKADGYALERLQDRHGPLPETLKQRTGKGGEQHFFRYPPGAHICNRTNLDNETGVDVRGYGGYAIVPPSVTVAQYVWYDDADPTDGSELAELPDEWVDLLAGNGQVEKHGLGDVPEIESVVLDVDVDLPDRVKSLIERHPKLARTFERDRPDLKDQSPSGYEYSIAATLGFAGCTLQEVTDAIVVWRRQHGEDLQKWAKNESRIRKALGRALAQRARAIRCGRLEKKNGRLVERTHVGLTEALAAEILADNHFAIDAGGKLYAYNNGVYKPNGAAVVKAHVVRLTRHRKIEWKSKIQSEVLEYISIERPRLWDRPPADTVNVRNGLLDVTTGDFRPHTPDWLSMVQLPVAYDRAAVCPNWDSFVETTFPEDARDVAWELPAWLMCPETSIKKAVLLLGEGDNGKSVYLSAVIAFVGRSNVANMSLHTLERDRFSSARLVGKLANVCADLPSEHLAGSSIFKAITGGDLIGAERKFQDGFDFAPFARLVFSANVPPRAPDADDAFFERWIVVPFTQVFRVGGAVEPIRRDILDGRLADPGELSGVLNKALIALRRLRTRGAFAESASMRSALDQFRQVTDPFSVWFEQHVIEDPAGIAECGALRTAYNAWADVKGKPPMTMTRFGLALKRLLPSVTKEQRTTRGALHWCYIGIGLRE